MGNFFEDLIHSVLESTLTEDEQAAIKAKFHKLKKEVIDDVRIVFPHGQILPASSGRGIRIRLPPGPSGDADDTVNADGLSPIQDVMNMYNNYVNNELPTYLIYVPEKKLVSRNEVKSIFRREMMAVTEDDISKVIAEAAGRSVPTREEAIRALIQARLKYATLSHRWLDRGEPTFHDIKMSFRPAGYTKLVEFCERAAEYGCRLAWSDTCCINKDSSTELEEAIRSMFKWYRDAHVCIAYLAETTSVDDLGKDVWFTRGWTLQELLAPRTMKFYGGGWTPLSNSTNDKHDVVMMNALSQATGIPLDDLRYFRPGTRDVHERMMWASTRTTTRIEDIAYCLIGIFDVSMTIAYGEGQRAFYRLMEAIINRCGEWQIMAWAGRPSADSAALPELPRCYKALSGTRAGTVVSPGGGNEYSQRAWRGDRNFIMTKGGLQLKLLIVDIPSPCMKLFEGVGDRSVECGRYGKCTVGVVDYWCYDTSGQGIMKPSHDHLCLLLRSDPFDPFAEWQKVSTPELLFVRAEIEVKGNLSMICL
ncbi:HET-domain-containing protein [Paxillus ammoniavirescens]|nr:HET-domain-containing protein [Paxillus ammoniavirescens]